MGACWAHNPEVDGSKPSSARIFFLFRSHNYLHASSKIFRAGRHRILSRYFFNVLRGNFLWARSWRKLRSFMLAKRWISTNLRENTILYKISYNQKWCSRWRWTHNVSVAAKLARQIPSKSFSYHLPVEQGALIAAGIVRWVAPQVPS